MKKSRFTETQISQVLKEHKADRYLSGVKNPSQALCYAFK